MPYLYKSKSINTKIHINAWKNGMENTASHLHEQHGGIMRTMGHTSLQFVPNTENISLVRVAMEK